MRLQTRVFPGATSQDKTSTGLDVKQNDPHDAQQPPHPAPLPASEPVGWSCQRPRHAHRKEEKAHEAKAGATSENRGDGANAHTARARAGLAGALPRTSSHAGLAGHKSCLLHLGLCHYFLSFKMNKKAEVAISQGCHPESTSQRRGARFRRDGPAFLGPTPRSQQHWLSACRTTRMLRCVQAPTFNLLTRA